MRTTGLYISQLDSLRAETMMALLNKEGRNEIWKYSVVTRRQAYAEAQDAMNFDNIQHAHDHKDKPYALIGPGIDDSYFGTVFELVSLCYWLCHQVIGAPYIVKPTEAYSNQVEVLEERKDYPWL